MTPIRYNPRFTGLRAVADKLRPTATLVRPLVLDVAAMTAGERALALAEYGTELRQHHAAVTSLLAALGATNVD